MDWQVLFNIAAGICGFLGAWVLFNLKESISDLRKTGAALSEKVQSIEVLVAGDYAKRDDVDKLGAALFAKLDKIENKLDQKADKVK